MGIFEHNPPRPTSFGGCSMHDIEHSIVNRATSTVSSGSRGGPGGAMAPPKFLPHNYSWNNYTCNATYNGMCGLALQILVLACI